MGASAKLAGMAGVSGEVAYLCTVCKSQGAAGQACAFCSSQSPPLPGGLHLHCSPHVCCQPCYLITESMSLFFPPPPVETKPFASQYRSICKQGKGGRPLALRSPRSAFRALFSKCSLSSYFPRSIFPAPLMLGLTLWFVLISRTRRSK